eukprot:865590_1
MAHRHPLETMEGNGDGLSELDQWLEENDLTEIKHIFQTKNVSFQELLELSEETEKDLREYGKDVLKLDLVSRRRFAKGVKSLSESPNDANNTPSTKEIVHIIITEQEQAAIVKIKEKTNHLNETLQTVMAGIDANKQTAKSHQKYIDNMEKELILKIQERMTHLKSEYKQSMDSKHQKLEGYVNLLQERIKAANEAQSHVDKLLIDTTIDAQKRKTKIVSLSNDVSTKVEVPDIAAKIQVKINKDKIFEYIARIGSVECFGIPGAPSFSVSDIECISATVVYRNKKLSYGHDIELARSYSGNDDEKADWETATMQEISKDKYKVLNLHPHTAYGVRSKFKTEHGCSKYSDVSTFTTKQKVDDQWDSNCKSKDFQIDNDVVWNSVHDWRSVFGKEICKSPYSYHWKLQIVKVTKQPGNTWPPLIGIQQNNGQEKKESDFTSYTCSRSVFAFIGGRAKLTTSGNDGRAYGSTFRANGDSIDVYLDMKNHTLSFGINDVKYGKAFDVGNVEYKLAVSFYSGMKLKMISFKKA